MYTKIISIDRETLINMQHSRTTVLTVYQHAIHLSVQDRIITVGYNIGKSKHHIVISDDLDFKTLKIETSMDVIILDKEIRVGELVLIIEDSAIIEHKPYTKKLDKSTNLDELKPKIINYIKDNHAKNYYHHKNTKLDRFVFERVKRFFNHPCYENASLLVGLGEGLTPLCDDILVGFIIAKNTIDEEITWINELLSFAKVKTNQFSYQNLLDVSHRYYSENFIELIESCNHHTLNQLSEILRIGYTSGAGMLTGFIEGLS